MMTVYELSSASGATAMFLAVLMLSLGISLGLYALIVRYFSRRALFHGGPTFPPFMAAIHRERSSPRRSDGVERRTTRSYAKFGAGLSVPPKPSGASRTRTGTACQVRPSRGEAAPPGGCCRPCDTIPAATDEETL